MLRTNVTSEKSGVAHGCEHVRTRNLRPFFTRETRKKLANGRARKIKKAKQKNRAKNTHQIKRKIFFSFAFRFPFLCERVATLRWGSAQRIWCQKPAGRNENFLCMGPTRNVFGLGPYIRLCVSNRS